MADPKLQGLFAELGIGVDNEEAALQQAAQQRQVGGSSNAAAFFNIGNANRQGILNAAGGLASGVGGLISGKGGRGFKEFGRDFARGGQNQRDEAIAQGANLQGGVEELRRGRKIREELSGVRLPNTGDPTNDQLAQLDEIIKVANKHGDTALIARANQRKLAVKQQQEAFEKADLANQQTQRDVDIQAEIDSTGHTVRLVGDDPDGAVSKAQINDDGTWTVFRPDGTTEQVDGGKLIFVDPSKAAPRIRKFETRAAQLQANITANKINPTKKRDELASFGEQSIIVGNMIGTVADMFDPRIAFSGSQAAVTAADKVITFADVFSNLFTRKGSPGNVTYNGKRVGGQQQYDLATNGAVFDSFLAESGLSIQDIMPPHLRGDKRAAQLFQANVMQLAYLDARLQEPSNRGLSDNDIKAALERIGIGTPDPAVFALRQKQVISRLTGKVDNLGTEFSVLPGGEVTKRELQDFVYNPDVTNRIRGVLAETDASLDNFLRSIAERDPTIPAPPVQAPPTQTREERRAALLGDTPRTQEDVINDELPSLGSN